MWQRILPVRNPIIEGKEYGALIGKHTTLSGRIIL